MKRLQFHSEDISKGDLILVNPSHPLKSYGSMGRFGQVGPGFSVRSDYPLVPVHLDLPHILLERQAAKMLTKITELLACEGEILPVSGYRTMREQEEIYATSLRENGEGFTQQYVALPGCSEHQTGLAIDLSENRETIDFIRPDFPYSGICGRFRKLSARYGFIERYPAGREHITGIAHEPWHFRYVGYPHSKIMEEKAFTLEEYMDYLKRFSYGNGHLQYRSNRRNFEIFYIPVREKEGALVEIPEDIPYQVSGNNENGVVITLWKERI